MNLVDRSHSASLNKRNLLVITTPSHASLDLALGVLGDYWLSGIIMKNASGSHRGGIEKMRSTPKKRASKPKSRHGCLTCKYVIRLSR